MGSSSELFDIGMIQLGISIAALGLFLLFAFLTAKLATRKGRRPGIWVFIFLFIGPLAMFLLLVLPKRSPEPDEPENKSEFPEHYSDYLKNRD